MIKVLILQKTTQDNPTEGSMITVLTLRKVNCNENQVLYNFLQDKNEEIISL